MEEGMTIIKSSSHRSTNKRVFHIITEEDITDKKILDIGAGKGYMSQLLGEHVRKKGKRPSEVITACDLFPEFFSYKGITCRKMKFINTFPFEEATFDIAYAIEVIEHLKNPSIHESNEQALKAINSWKLCCSRSAILVGYK